MSETPHFSPQSYESIPAQITLPTAEEFAAMAQVREAEETVRRAEIADWRKAEKRKQWKGRMKKVMAATALLATVKSGGFIDMAADPFSDAADTARSAVEVTPVTLPDEMDGIKFEDYSPEVQAEYIADQTQRVEKETTAKDTVVKLFERADSEGYQGIIAEVNAEKQAHPELFVSEEVIAETKQAIEDAETNQQAVDVLNDFMSGYGIAAGFHEAPFDDKHSELQDVLTAYVDVFSALPKDLIRKAKLTNVTVSSTGVTSIDGAGMEGGSYSPNDNSLNMVVRSRFMDAASKLESALDGDDYGYQSLVAHELGHALDEHEMLYAQLDQDATEEDISGKAMFVLAGQNVINRPDYLSAYSRTSSNEHTAEVLSGVLSDRDNGLATTDEWRRFGSQANKSMIDMLAQLEAIRPGIAKILISNRL